MAGRGLDPEGLSSLGALFLARARLAPERRAFCHPRSDGGGSDHPDEWEWLTWEQTEARVRAIACGLASLDLGLEDRVAILSSTRLEWILADLGILCAGGATTTIYPSNTPEECAYILADSGTTIAFAENDEQVAKLRAVREKLPDLTRVVTFDGTASEDGWVVSLADLERLGGEFDRAQPGAFESAVARPRPHHLSTLIYTSGTTGPPKGVELTHDCWLFVGFAFAATHTVNEEDHQYLWLPLAHSFGKLLEVSQLAIGFSSTVDGRIPKLVENLAVTRPTFMAAAPRIFEKVYNKVISGAQEQGGLRYAIFKWAVGVGRRVSKQRQQGHEPGGLLAVQAALADRLVFSRLKQTFGGRVRFFISGSAPLAREIAEFFHAAGILILEGYGLTETSAGAVVNLPRNYAFGSVGHPLPGVEIEIAPDDGEILLRSRGVMRGYRNRPDATAEALTPDRWLHTGDIGELDESGRLRITDRKKDLIKTSGGKYVAPQSLEGRLKARCPYIGQVVVHGNNRNFCTALITIDEEAIAGWQQEHGLGHLSYEALAREPAVRELVQQAVDDLNADLASFESIKKFALLPEDLTVEAGDLTASLKVKRKVVEQKYADVLDGFYEGSLEQL